MAYTPGYSCDMGSPNCRMEGLIFDSEYIESIFTNEVKCRLADQKGSEQLISRFDDIPSTGFEETRIKEIFTLDEKNYNPWQVGEAFSDYFLEEDRNVRIRTHNLRDLKNPNASSTGTDIIGFVDLDNETIFVFGEVKTSSDQNSPPSLLNGRSGLKGQINDLTKNYEVKDNLVKFIGHKVVDLPNDNEFVDDYENALKSYLKDSDRVHLYGILVRDVECKISDLNARYDEYKDNLERSTILYFLGLYIPIDAKKWNELIRGN